MLILPVDEQVIVSKLALTILTNISSDRDVLSLLAMDHPFLEHTGHKNHRMLRSLGHQSQSKARHGGWKARF